MSPKRKKLTPGETNYVLIRQFNRCANRPESMDTSFFFEHNGQRYKYNCPMWRLNDGMFDASVFEADHIIEHAEGGGESIDNFQLLCPCCHSVKTKNYTHQAVVDGYRLYNSAERGAGMGPMDQLAKKEKRPPVMRSTPTPMEFGENNDITYLLSL